MKKFYSILSLILLVFIGCGFFTSCDKEKNYSLTDIKNKYNSMVSFYANGTSNSKFNVSDNNNANTIKITYTYKELNSKVNSATPSTDADKRFSSLKLYDNLFDSLQSYYEVYNNNFYSVEGSINQDALNNLYSKLTNLENRLKSFDAYLLEFQDELKSLGLENPPALSVKSLTYEYNKLVDSVIDFEDCFIETHKKYVFGEEQNDQNALIRNFEEGKFDIARICYYENFKSLNNTSGQNGATDLLPLYNSLNNKSFNENDSELILLYKYVLEINKLTPIFNNDNLINLKYYKSSYDQNFEFYKAIYNDFDMYNLELNRLNGFDGANLEAYISRFINTDKVDYLFMQDFKTKILKSYYNSLIKATEKKL